MKIKNITIYSLAILAISLSSTTSTTTSNLLSRSIEDPFHLDQIHFRWLDEDSQNDDGTINCKSPILDSYNNNVTCVDASGSDRIGNGTIFIGNSVTSTDGIAVDSYRGIEYATQERFAPSEIHFADGAVNATEYGDDCAQAEHIYSYIEFNNESLIEDCLYLNVWKPSTTNDGDLLPVMVFIHGGGGTHGSGSEPQYDATNLAGNEDVVVVTLNYRLGMFGFMPTSTDGTGGMNGILDQVQALEWVQQYISYFGGDKNRITIFGESAGAMSIASLSVIPQANGLFDRAIMESGNGWWGEMYGTESSMETVNKVLNEIDCSVPPCTISDLKNLNTQELLNFTNSFGSATFDSNVLPADLITLYSTRGINPTDMIIGANTYDDPTQLLGLQTIEYITMANNGIEESSFWNFANSTSNEKQGAVDAYPIDKYNSSTVSAFAQFQGDFLMNCPSRDLAETISSMVDGKIYNYLFGYLSVYDYAKTSGLLDEENITDPNWATHMAELVFVFGNPIFHGSTSPPPPFTDKDKSLSKEIMSRWANFARSGNPSASTGSASTEVWVPVSGNSSSDNNGTAAAAAADPRYMYFTGDGGTMMESNPEKMEQCASAPFYFVVESNNNSSSSSNNKKDNNNNTTNGNIDVSDGTGNYTTPSSSSSGGSDSSSNSSNGNSSKDSNSDTSGNIKVGAGNNIMFSGLLAIAIILGCMMM
mmetsp:Transcript_44575/g.51420  ORF Transcript_44575/g.51420 Transcript_44575/m.51420 type:complete len:705 (+) Transcript_44575:209-2323(+)